jgi:hypothetical protein
MRERRATMARLLGSVWEMAGTVSSGNAGSGSTLENTDNSKSVDPKNHASGGIVKAGYMKKHNMLTLLALTCMISGTAFASDMGRDNLMPCNPVHERLFMPEQHPKQLIPACAACACEEFMGMPLRPEGDLRSIYPDMSPKENLR